MKLSEDTYILNFTIDKMWSKMLARGQFPVGWTRHATVRPFRNRRDQDQVGKQEALRAWGCWRSENKCRNGLEPILTGVEGDTWASGSMLEKEAVPFWKPVKHQRGWDWVRPRGDGGLERGDGNRIGKEKKKEKMERHFEGRNYM